MSRHIQFSSTGWEDYLYWQKIDKKIVRRINRLIAEATRTPFEGAGKPEPLKENYAGLWSRRVDAEHRLIYQASDDAIYIIACRYHYDK